MFTHYDSKRCDVTVKFSTSQDADTILSDISRNRLTAGNYCDMREVTITEVRQVKLSVRESPAIIAERKLDALR